MNPSAFTQRAIATYFPGGAGENGQTQHIANHAHRPSSGETLDVYADKKLRIEKRKYAKIQSALFLTFFAVITSVFRCTCSAISDGYETERTTPSVSHP